LAVKPLIAIDSLEDILFEATDFRNFLQKKRAQSERSHEQFRYFPTDSGMYHTWKERTKIYIN
jgi:hypothetical protein